MPTPSNTSSETRPPAEWGAVAYPCSDRSEAGQHPGSGKSRCRSNARGWRICEWARSPRSRSRNQTHGSKEWNRSLSSFCLIRLSAAAVQTAPVRTSLRPVPQTERRHQHPDNRTLMKPRVARVQVPSASVSVRRTETPVTFSGSVARWSDESQLLVGTNLLKKPSQRTGGEGYETQSDFGWILQAVTADEPGRVVDALNTGLRIPPEPDG